jgi:hypothetical protein
MLTVAKEHIAIKREKIRDKGECREATATNFSHEDEPIIKTEKYCAQIKNHSQKTICKKQSK